MKIFQIIIAFISSVFITFGGGIGALVIQSNGTRPNDWALICLAAASIGAAFKDVRNLMALPPLSNGNYATLRELMDYKKSGDTDTIARLKQKYEP